MRTTRRLLLQTACAAPALSLAPPLFAEEAGGVDHAGVAHRAVEQSILPAADRLAEAARALAGASASDALADWRPPFQAALDAWAGAAHLRFGATEEESRAFAIAFWPDTRGRTQRALTRFIAAEDPSIDDPEAFARASVAVRGLTALERLLYAEEPLTGYRLRLARAIALDLARTTEALAARWRDPYAGLLLSAGAPENPLYFTPEEATIELFKALNTGLEVTGDLRLGRPLGTFDRPRPRRAEFWRAGASLRLVRVSIAALEAYYATVFAPELSAEADARIKTVFARAARDAAAAPEPLDQAVTAPQTRLQIEAIKVSVDAIRAEIGLTLGPALGAGVTFNSLDGD